jgi:peptide-methionine (S)-S-oxide reductase
MMPPEHPPSPPPTRWGRRAQGLALVALALGLSLSAWYGSPGAQLQPAQAADAAPGAGAASPLPAGAARAILAGGCFWCVEADFDKVPGVLATTSGYIGGSADTARYEQVSTQRTGHVEAVEIVYDPRLVSYEQLLAHFWRSIDPTTPNQQFCDVGPAYRSAIFTLDEAQWAAAQQSLAQLQQTKPFKEPIVTEVARAGPFYPAEAYHQDYYKKNAVRYSYYRASCGRDVRLAALWGPASAGR